MTSRYIWNDPLWFAHSYIKVITIIEWVQLYRFWYKLYQLWVNYSYSIVIDIFITYACGDIVFFLKIYMEICLGMLISLS